MSDNLYNDAFYDKQSKDSYESGLIVLSLLKQLLNKVELKSIVDFGCGVGSWLAAAKKAGFSMVQGTDGAYVSLEKLMIESEEFVANDLSEPLNVKLPREKYDLAISLEVAEHLPESASNSFVEKITSSADLILFSAAVPYQGGHGHINENWLSYWDAKFKSKGFTAVDLIRPHLWNNQKVCWWYRQNLMVFIKNDTLSNLPVTTANHPLDFIHPEQYLVAIHREKTQRHSTLSQDIKYFGTSSRYEDSDILSYGREYSYTEDEKKPIETIEELKAYAQQTTNYVLLDALSDIETKDFNLEDFKNSVKSPYKAPDFLCVGAQKSGTTWF